jgi:hypothetical protein
MADNKPAREILAFELAVRNLCAEPLIATVQGLRMRLSALADSS